MHRSTYLQERYRQLNNPQHYRKLDQPIYIETAKKITKILRLMLHKTKVITNRQFVPQMSRDHAAFICYLKSTNLPVNGLSPTKCQKVDQLYQIVIAFQKK